ncbi:hypothetical protein CsSME_00051890 [Camellia sinensis var. sinensis]
MGDIEETYLKSDEAIPLSSSQATSKAYTFGCEVSYIEPHAKLSNSWFHEHTWMGPLMSISRTAPLMSIYKVLINTKINILLPFGPLAILLHYLTGKHVRSTDFRYHFFIHFIQKGMLLKWKSTVVDFFIIFSNVDLWPHDVIYVF